MLPGGRRDESPNGGVKYYSIVDSALQTTQTAVTSTTWSTHSDDVTYITLQL